jgi:transposase-like protein
VKRKKYTPEFKFQVVLDSIKSDSVSQVARAHGLGANQVSEWRRQFFERGSKTFEPNGSKEKTKLKRRIADLERMLGKKEVELGLLKNFADFYSSQDGN